MVPRPKQSNSDSVRARSPTWPVYLIAASAGPLVSAVLYLLTVAFLATFIDDGIWWAALALPICGAIGAITTPVGVKVGWRIGGEERARAVRGMTVGGLIGVAVAQVLTWLLLLF